MESEAIRNLKDSLLDIQEQIQAIEARAEAEDRDLTEDEDKEMRSLFSQFDSVSDQIERKERIENQREKLAQSMGRQAEPNPTEPQAAATEPNATPANRRKAILEPQFTRDKGKWGWKNMGEYAIAVRQAARQGSQLDPRLVMNAPSTYSQEGVGADGGFAVPPDFRQEIWQKVNGEDSLLAMTDQNPTSKNTIVFPADETTPWDSSGGIQAYFESEAGQLTQSKVALQDKTIRLNKLTALVPVTEELMEDAPGLDGYLRKKVGEKFDFKLNLKFVQGTGAGEPLGILNAASLVSAAKESGQSADTIVAENIMNMWTRMYAPCRRNAVWLINQDIEAQLMQMVIQGTNSGVFPVYMPPSGLSAAPYGTLMGRPVFPTQACETLGDKGDIILVDMKQYMTALKTGNLRTDVSMHLWFDYDVLAYRFILRIAGQPWWASYITPRDSSNYISWAVTLDERA